jgi:hypothetical protein
MGKRNQPKNDTPVVSRNNKVDATLRRKAKKVIQSNGIPYFEEWCEKQPTGGGRRKASRPSFKSSNPKLMRQLIEQYHAKGRKMDLPPEEKVEEVSDS